MLDFAATRGTLHSTLTGGGGGGGGGEGGDKKLDRIKMKCLNYFVQVCSPGTMKFGHALHFSIREYSHCT